MPPNPTLAARSVSLHLAQQQEKRIAF